MESRSTARGRCNSKARNEDLRMRFVGWKRKPGLKPNASEITETPKRKRADPREEIPDFGELSAAFSGLPDAVALTDVHGMIVFVNKAMEDLAGLNAQEVVGKRLTTVLHIMDGDTLEPSSDLLIKALSERIPLKLTDQILLNVKEEALHPVSISSTMISDVGNGMRGSIVVLHGLSECLKKHEVLAMQEKLEAMRVLAGAFAHDFNNALCAVLGYINLARIDMEESEEVCRRLEKAEESVMIAARVIRQLLMITERGNKPPTRPEPVLELIKAACKEARLSKDVQVALSVPEETWRADVNAAEMSHAIAQILNNSDHAMPAGGVIEVSAENSWITEQRGLSPAPGYYVKLSIRDHGVGITEKHLRSIFDPYFTTQPAGSTKGTGLGLSIAHSVIRKHAGHIAFESKVGVGTTAHIYLPGLAEEGLLLSDQAPARPDDQPGELSAPYCG